MNPSKEFGKSSLSGGATEDVKYRNTPAVSAQESLLETQSMGSSGSWSYRHSLPLWSATMIEIPDSQKEGRVHHRSGWYSEFSTSINQKSLNSVGKIKSQAPKKISPGPALQVDSSKEWYWTAVLTLSSTLYSANVCGDSRIQQDFESKYIIIIWERTPNNGSSLLLSVEGY